MDISLLQKRGWGRVRGWKEREREGGRVVKSVRESV
jgi:hypothetical protein